MCRTGMRVPIGIATTTLVVLLQMLKMMPQNVGVAKRIIRTLCGTLSRAGSVEWPSHSALGGGLAVMTRPELIPEDARQRMDLFLGRYLWPGGGD